MRPDPAPARSSSPPAQDIPADVTSDDSTSRPSLSRYPDLGLDPTNVEPSRHRASSASSPGGSMSRFPAFEPRNTRGGFSLLSGPALPLPAPRTASNNPWSTSLPYAISSSPSPIPLSSSSPYFLQSPTSPIYSPPPQPPPIMHMQNDVPLLNYPSPRMSSSPPARRPVPTLTAVARSFVPGQLNRPITSPPDLPPTSPSNHPRISSDFLLSPTSPPFTPSFSPPLQAPSPGSLSTEKQSDRRRKRKSQDTEISPERKPYHPKPPVGGSNWTMWVGNIPGDATSEEANTLFQDTSPFNDSASTDPEDSGVISVFLIVQSHCAFVNYSSKTMLDRAIAYHNGRHFRTGGLKMVCRVRNKDEEIKSGVGAQRGFGLHRQWVKERHGMAWIRHQPQPLTLRPDPKPDAEHDGGGSDSSVSTTSSLLERYFPIRYFVLKSLSKNNLALSVSLGYWATQNHNESVLNRAFRTSQTVYLIFGANKSGEFFGYGTMESAVPSAESGYEAFLEAIQTARVLSPDVLVASADPVVDGNSFEQHLLQYEAYGLAQRKHMINDDEPIPLDFPAKSSEDAARSWGVPFRVKWHISTALPFHQTRSLRNAWNKEREVKVSRDGTELEPSVGQTLIELWQAQLASVPEPTA